MPITWKKDPFQAEKGELKRVADEASPDSKAALESLNYLKTWIWKNRVKWHLVIASGVS